MNALIQGTAQSIFTLFQIDDISPGIAFTIALQDGLAEAPPNGYTDVEVGFADTAHTGWGNALNGRMSRNVTEPGNWLSACGCLRASRCAATDGGIRCV